jgi:hypothetical protein
VRAALVAVVLTLLAPARDASSTLEGFGLRLTLPSGWHGTLYRRSGEEPVLHAATFPLPPGDDDLASKATRAMRRGDILVVLLEKRPTARGYSYNPARLPLKIVRGNVRPLGGRAVARRTFSLNDRKFELSVEFGSRPVTSAQLARANRLLAGFSSATPP